MSSLNEPLGFYRDELRDAHASRVKAYFEDLVVKSGVDAEQNRRTILEMASLESDLSKNNGQKSSWFYLRVALWSIAIIAFFMAFGGGLSGFWLLLSAPLITLDLWQVGPKIRGLKDANAELQMQIDQKSEEAWVQMQGLNRLFRWGISKELMALTLPELQLDDHFSEESLHDLVHSYGLNSSFHDGRSMLRLHSGRLFENPVVISRHLQHWIGTMQYTGNLMIYWTESVRNSQGQNETVQRSQNLTAFVLKPFPDFSEGASVIFGHEAAPSLSFSRVPSNLSGLEETRFNDWRKSNAIRGVEKKAKKEIKSGSGQFTVMSNRDFEALFKATDRDHEIEFRLLYTPLAQQETLKILNDTSEGYGDSFGFIKRGKTNHIESSPLGGMELDPEPSFFFSNNLEESRESFNDFNNEFFRSVYFAIAPLVAIPLYTETRRLPAASGLQGDANPNAWEVEVLVNYLGEDRFRHAQSVTRNLITAKVLGRRDGGVVADVEALGYKGIDRVDYVSVLGGDGRWHQVPVGWVEYKAVAQRSQVFVARVKEYLDPNIPGGIERHRWTDVVQGLGSSESNSVLRGSLGAAII